jgi:N utilization substance protein B
MTGMSDTGRSQSDGGHPGAPRAPDGLSRRGAARLAAIQALYQLELTGATPNAVIEEFVRHRLGEEQEGLNLAELDRGLFASLVQGVAKERDQLDDMLSAVLAEDWPVERLERILRVILRTGTYELAHFSGTPARVVISEYVALTDGYFLGKEPAMANGVLDRLARSLRPEEFPDSDDDYGGSGGGDTGEPA